MSGARSYLTFILNGVEQRVSGVAPTTTLLQWLRRERRLTGCKEGCAEGGCGACTVVVGRRGADGVEFSTLNACLALLPMLEGMSVTTVEGVAAADGSLHPCQRAMVECHGSQCGYCTPGFVMSLYALWHNAREAPDGNVIDDVLGGNLCRCTGYGPIVAAARRMFELAPPAEADDGRAQARRQLAAIQHGSSIRIEHAEGLVLVPTTEDELALLYAAHPDATLIAGATDVGIGVTKRQRRLPVAIFLGRVDDMAASVTPAHDPAVVLPANRTLADMLHHDVAGTPDLAELLRRFAGPQIRTAGTIGGNIANGSPIGDLAPALIALRAVLHLRRGDKRRFLPLEDYFIAYGRQDRTAGEFVTAIELPGHSITAANFRCHKVSKRFDDDISAVCGAFVLEIDGATIAGARIAFGGMAATPKRARAVETALIGRPWTRVTIDAAAEHFAADFSPISDVRASAGYRLQVARNLLVRTFIERTSSQVATRLAGEPVLEGA